MEELQPLGEFNRFEVIDHTEMGEGREFVRWEGREFKVEYSIQDEGRTIKVFLNSIS